VSIFGVLRLVISEVSLEIGGGLQLLLADGALDLLVVRVGHHVPVDQVALGVVLATEFAPEGN
jgi:hypothetical protein